MKCDASVRASSGCLPRIMGTGLATVVAGALSFGADVVAAQTNAALAPFEMHTVSTRADAVSGGEVLAEITTPPSVAPAQVLVTLNGRDVRVAFRPGSHPGALLGRVSGLSLGENRLEASAPGQVSSRVTVINHPSAGPVISGPHQTPFVCETQAHGLGPAPDANCSVEKRVEYFYRSKADAPAQAPAAAGNSAAALAAPDATLPRAAQNAANAPNPFKPFDPAGPRPADLAEMNRPGFSRG